MATRDELRSILLATPAFRSKLVKVGEQEFEVREPTVAERAAIFRAARIPGTTDFDNARVSVEAVIACTFKPGTSEKIFAITDTDMLLAQPLGGWFDEFQREAMDFVNKSAVVAKNSPAIASAK